MIRLAGYLLTGRAYTLVVTVFVGAIINHTLGVETRGYYAEILSWIAIVTAISSLSIDKITYHYANRNVYENSESVFIGTSFLSLLIPIAIAVSATLIMNIFLHMFTSEEMARNMYVMLMVIVVGLISNMASVLCHTLGLIKETFWLFMITPTILLVGVIVQNAFGIMTITWLLVTISLSHIILLIGHVYKIKEVVLFPWRGDFLLLIKMIKSGVKQHLSTVCSILYVQFDQIMLINMEGAVDTGLYSVVVSLCMGMLILPAAIRDAVYPRFIKSKTNDDIYYSGRVSLYLITLVLMLFYSFSDYILLLYAGGEFSSGGELFPPVLIGILFYTIQVHYSPYFIKEGLFVFNSVISILLLVLNLFMNYLLIPLYSGMGAAFATLICYVIGAIIVIGVIKKREKISVVNFFYNGWREINALYREISVMVLYKGGVNNG